MGKDISFQETEYDVVEPYAASMCESLRAFGYELPSAIADLVDNSIFAEAENIWLNFFWNGENSAICVTDDGKGLEEKDLIDAMRPGNRNPLEDRDPKDLGRYGLGLKTASFSQCRRLTVLSKTVANHAAIRCWDLDFISQENKWLLLRNASPAAEKYFEKLTGLEHGTAVLWEKMDRIVKDSDVDNETHRRFFHQRIAGVETHLGMVFHRFMEGKKRLKITINNKHEVEPWDPFLTNEKAVQQIADERIKFLQSHINIIPYVLPHSSKISQEKCDKAAGPKGWNAHQGFYVYRNRRLLIPGDWLGLPFAKEEHFKLARILLDIPNSTDQEWEIDVTKSKARPPDVLRADLKRIADITRRRASEIYRHRGKALARSTSREFVFVWQQVVKHGKFFYKINREHPLVKEVLGGNVNNISALLRLVEETVPVPLLIITNSEKPDKHGAPFEGSPTKEIVELLERVYLVMVESKIPHREAVGRLRVMEPFDRYPELVESYIEKLKEKTDG